MGKIPLQLPLIAWWLGSLVAMKFAQIFLVTCWITSLPKTKFLREPQHTPGAYPRLPQIPKWKEFLHKLLVGGLGYVPFGVCWKILRKLAFQTSRGEFTQVAISRVYSNVKCEQWKRMKKKGGPFIKINGLWFKLWCLTFTAVRLHTHVIPQLGCVSKTKGSRNHYCFPRFIFPAFCEQPESWESIHGNEKTSHVNSTVEQSKQKQRNLSRSKKWCFNCSHLHMSGPGLYGCFQK